MIGRLTLSAAILAGGMTAGLAQTGSAVVPKGAPAGTMMMMKKKTPSARTGAPGETTTGRASPRGGPETPDTKSPVGTAGAASGTTATGTASPKGGSTTPDAPK